MQGYDKDEEADRNLAYIGGSEIKRHYELNMERKLQSLGANIDQWSGQAEIMAVEKMKELRRKQAEASKRLEELKAASGEAWGEFKQGLDRACEDLAKAFDELKSSSAKALSKFNKS